MRSFSKWPVAEAAALLFIGTVVYIFEVVSAATLYWQFCLGALVVGALFALPRYVQRGCRRGLGLFAAFGLVLTGMHFTDLSPVKPFTRFYNAVQPGMSRSQVQALFDEQFPYNGAFERPSENHSVSSWTDTSDSSIMAYHSSENLHFTLNPQDGRYNAETINISLQDDVVDSTDYSAD